MVKNFTNMNQSEKSPFTSTHLSLIKKRPRHNMTLKIEVLAWDRHTDMAGLYRFMGSKPYRSW